MMWSIRTTATKPTGETPFFLVYGAEAVLGNVLISEKFLRTRKIMVMV